MPMSLERWDRVVRSHLDMIEAGAAMCLSHVTQLPLRPGFETKAEDALLHCEKALGAALTTVQAALKAYRDKPKET